MSVEKSLNIALDFDGTFTEDPESWIKFCTLFRAAGHKIYVVTMRYPNDAEKPEVEKELGPYVDGMFFTSRRAKMPYMEQNHPETPISIWIDDRPWWLLKNSY